MNAHTRSFTQNHTKYPKPSHIVPFGHHIQLWQCGIPHLEKNLCVIAMICEKIIMKLPAVKHLIPVLAFVFLQAGTSFCGSRGLKFPGWGVVLSIPRSTRKPKREQ